MEIKTIRRLINRYCTKHDITSLIVDNAYYDASIIGIDDEGRVIYDYDEMIKEYVFDENPLLDVYSEEADDAVMDATDFISYNSIRALSYMSDNGGLLPKVLMFNPSTEVFDDAESGEEYSGEIVYRIDTNKLAILAINISKKLAVLKYKISNSKFFRSWKKK